MTCCAVLASCVHETSVQECRHAGHCRLQLFLAEGFPCTACNFSVGYKNTGMHEWPELSNAKCNSWLPISRDDAQICNWSASDIVCKQTCWAARCWPWPLSGMETGQSISLCWTPRSARSCAGVWSLSVSLAWTTRSFRQWLVYICMYQPRDLHPRGCFQLIWWLRLHGGWSHAFFLLNSKKFELTFFNVLSFNKDWLCLIIVTYWKLFLFPSIICWSLKDSIEIWWLLIEILLFPGGWFTGKISWPYWGF